MRKRIISSIILICILSAVRTADACTVFNASDGSTVLVGNNEDGINIDAKACFLPPEKGKYGVVLFGFDDAWIQGGMNDQGLFLDWANEEHQEIDFPENGNYYRGNYNILYEGNLNEKILRGCSNVNEVIEMYQKYNEIAFYEAHVMVTDKTGASVIIEPYEGTLKMIRKKNNYQFMTNFNITNSEMVGYDCPRYSFLTRNLGIKGDVSVDYFKFLMARVIPPASATGPLTAYSNIYDLTGGNIYIYYLHDFQNGINFNLEEELSKGRHMYNLHTLFHNNQEISYTEGMNNLGMFSALRKQTRVEFAVGIILLVFWPILYLIRFILFLLRRQKVRADKLSIRGMTGILLSFINILFCFLLLMGLIKYGFYIRYGFNLYQKFLMILPPVIILLTLLQFIFMLASWKMRYWSFYEKILYTVITACMILVSFNMLSWCWHI